MRTLVTSVFALSLCLGSTALAQPTTSDDIGAIPLLIDSAGSARVRISLAVPDALNLGGSDPANLTATITRTMRRDLELAGYFQLLTPAQYFFDQHADGMTAATINFDNWYNVGAQALVKSGFRVAGTQVRLDFRLFNVDAGEEVPLAFQPVSVGFGDVEEQVHEFVNQVVEYFSGYRGPFGSRIVFVGRGRDGSREIYTMTVGGDDISSITSNGSLNILPEWAGRGIVYTSYRDGNPDLVLYRDGEHRVLSNRPGLNTGGALSPNGSELAMVLSMDGNSEIYIVSPEDGSIIRRLTDNRAEDVSPVWSPSGRRIAFVSDRSGGPQIYVMNADGSDQRRVTFAGNYNTTPDYSPDGTRIAFTGRDSRNRFDIFTVDVGTSHIERLTQDQGNNEDPSWSPDGQFLVFSSTRGDGEPRLYIMTADGNYQTLLTRQGSGYVTPAWRR